MSDWTNVNWDSTQPIYQQLRHKLITLILTDIVKAGEMMPSVRTVAADFQLNPLTVTKSYQLLVEDDLLEKRRGMGMFVKPDAKKRLTQLERDRFLNDEWPALKQRMTVLNINWKELD